MYIYFILNINMIVLSKPNDSNLTRTYNKFINNYKNIKSVYLYYFMPTKPKNITLQIFSPSKTCWAGRVFKSNV